ncbi:DNA-directed DNA polymerase alpha catalytic subunit pol1 [Batrachochytrium dendrobatidis]|nr:DNA-directed DNA polymerase alpha catalytic subunit pol1 [Batrachochytrium dendrobatidis]
MTKFSSTAQSRSFDDTSAADIYTFESQISDEEKFKDIKRWSPRCIHCGESSEFKGAVYFKARIFAVQKSFMVSYP